MTRPATPATRYILKKLLEVVPESTALEPFRDLNLNKWRTQGAHSHISSTKSLVTIAVNQREYAATLIAEAQHLLNHANEHRAHLINYGASAIEPSPSWMFVSLYYFSLFIAMTWTRVLNAAIIYLDADAIKEFCGNTNIYPGGGAYKLSLKVDDATSASSVELKKCNASHFHEAVWITACQESEAASAWVKALSISRKPTNDELTSLRIFSLFTGVGFDKPLVWQSKLRNAINYRPGFSYRTIVHNNFLSIRSLLSRPAFPDIDSVLSYGERAKSQIKGNKSPVEFPNQSMELLISQSLVLESIIEDALEALCAFRQIKCSGPGLRKRFIATNCLAGGILTRVHL